MTENALIGVFDSGVGGLTVVREIFRQLPDEGVVYLGDTARVPYGTRSPETVGRYAREGVNFLMGKGIKALVVACNTVSAVCLDEIARLVPVPVIGVLEPGARAAATATRNGHVGVIGTLATVRSGAYKRAIEAIRPGTGVTQQACPLFVPLVEEGWLKGDVPALVVKNYLEPLKGAGIDTLVLGCTHYPLLKPALEAFAGPDITLVDSAVQTARALAEELRTRGLSATEGGARSEFYVTDAPDNFGMLAEKFLPGGLEERIYKIELEVAS